MRVYQGQFTAADETGATQGLQLDCQAEKIDLRGATFYADGTFTTGSVKCQHARKSDATFWSNVGGLGNAVSADAANGPATQAGAHCRVVTTADFTGSVDWKLVIPSRSRIRAT